MSAGIMNYKGYSALIEYSADDGCLVGRVLGINDSVTFHGDSVEDMKHELKVSVDEYLKACVKLGKQPNKPSSGKMLVRLPVELHSDIMRTAEVTGRSANQLVIDALQSAYSGRSVDKQQNGMGEMRPKRRENCKPVRV